MIFDTHAHYDDEAFDGDREELLSSMEGSGIGRIVNVCASPESLDATVKLTEEYPFIYGAVGIHPDDAPRVDEELLSRIRKLLSLPKVVAVGEIGLDYHWHKEEEERALQRSVFRAQMDLARQEKKPFMIHSREAAADTLIIVKEFMARGMSGGILHCFSYEKEMALEYVKMGLYLGVGGVVTFKNARKLKEVVEAVPLSSLVLETDCPYMAPEPYRGRRNSSLYLPYVVQAIAGIKGISEEEVIEQTAENASRLLGVPLQA